MSTRKPARKTPSSSPRKGNTNRSTATQRRSVKDKELAITPEEGRKTSAYRKIRAARMADARDGIEIGKYVGIIQQVDAELLSISTTLRDGILVDGDGTVITDTKALRKGKRIYLIPRCDEYEERLYRLRVLALDKRADHAFRMLRKVLPDLKSEEVGGEEKKDSATALRESLDELMVKYQ